MAQMLKGGVIMDVVNVEQARIAEEAGAPRAPPGSRTRRFAKPMSDARSSSERGGLVIATRARTSHHLRRLFSHPPQARAP